MVANPMTLQAYQTEARKTDRTRDSKPLVFLLLGLFGEIGTLTDVVKKKHRDSRSYVGYEASVLEELGDVLWYLTNIADRQNLALSSIARHASEQDRTSYAEAGEPLTFASLQPQSLLPLNVPTPDFERTLMRLVSGIGGLASAQASAQLNSSALGAGLAEVFSALIQAANEAGVTLERAAHQNLDKTFERWPICRSFSELFDETYDAEERLPRQMCIEIYERVLNRGERNEKQYVLQRSNGIFIGDRVTDNILEPDDYRFHDVFHYSYAAVLGWSPVIRALLRLKRKSNPKIDEGQDGARAVLIEEGVSTFIFAYAKHLELFKGLGPGDLSFTLLKRVKEFVHGYEVDNCPIWLWEEAILQGYEAFRFVHQHRRGRLIVDMNQRALKVEPLPQTDGLPGPGGPTVTL